MGAPDDDGNPVHPEELGPVTFKSLRKAFPAMSPENADYLLTCMQWEQDKIDHHEKHSFDEGVASLVVAAKTLKERVHAVAERTDVYMQGVCIAETARQLRSLAKVVRKAQRDNKEIERQVQALACAFDREGHQDRWRC